MMKIEVLGGVDFMASNDAARALSSELGEFLQFQSDKMIAADPTGDRTRAYTVLRSLKAKIDNHLTALKEAQNARAIRDDQKSVRELYRVRR